MKIITLSTTLIPILASCCFLSVLAQWDGQGVHRLMQVFGFVGREGKGQRMVSPQYMLQLYDSIADRETGVTRNANPYQADVVRSFHDSDSPHDLTHFLFHVDGLDEGEKLIEAEFHFFRLKAKNYKINKKQDKLGLYEMRVYQVMDPLLSNEEEGNKLLDARRISGYSSGWEIFHVREAVDDWIRNKSSNHGLLITLRSLIGKKVDSNVIKVLKRKHPNGRQPILVIFTKNSNKTNVITNLSDGADTFSRQKRSSPSSTSLPPTPTSPPECSRHELYVDFEQIGWSSWIISPKGYNAYYCSGQCSFPLGQNQRPTNHATVQSIVYEMNLHSGGVKAPCCVPNKLQSITLLFFDENDNVILKQYDDMVASVCGCH